MIAVRARLPTPHTIIVLCDLIRTDESAIKVSEGCIGDQASFIHYESIGGAFVYTNNESTEHTVRRRGAWILETGRQYNHAHTHAINQTSKGTIQNKPHPFGTVPVQPIPLIGIQPSSHTSDGNHAILETGPSSQLVCEVRPRAGK